ncbi:MAG: hypothetical protein ACI9FR_000679 [Cryomorphaceae bacterium]
MFDSQLKELSAPAWQLAFAGEFADQWQFYFAEDISVNRAPDLSIGANWQSSF